MAIHPDSSASTLSNLELFNTPFTHVAVENSRYVKCKPITSIDRGSPLEFRIKSDQSEYIDLSQSVLHMRCRILARDGKELKSKVSDTDPTIPDRSVVFPINYISSSLHKQCEIYVSNTLISSNDTMYPYRAFLEALLSYSSEAKKEMLAAGGFFTETENLNEIEKIGNKGAGDIVNESAVRRFKMTQFGKAFEVFGRIHGDLLNQGRFLMGNTDLKIVLHRHSPDFFLMAQTDTEYVLEIESASFYVKHDTITASIREAHLLKLQTETIKYPIKRVVMKYFTKGSHRDDLSEQNISEGILPTRIVIGFVDSRAFSGRRNFNPFNFENVNIRSVILRVRGKALPFEEIEVNFEQDNYLMGYLTLFQGTDTLFSNKTLGITPELYKQGHSIFVFDLESNVSCGELSLLKEGSVGIEIKLNDTTANSMTMIAYLEYQDMIELDSDLKVVSSSS